MIQIQRRQQFTRASARARKERMFVRPLDATRYAVSNRSKGTTYTVRFVSINSRPFGQCSCEAGTPSRADQVPMVCKHLAAAVTVHVGLARLESRAMTRSTRMLAARLSAEAVEDAERADWMAEMYDMQRD